MNRRVVAAVVVTAALLTGCSDGGDTGGDASTETAITEPVSTEPSAEPSAGPSDGSEVVLRFGLAGDADTLQGGAEVLRSALEQRGVAGPQVSVDGDRLVVRSEDPGLAATVESVISGGVSLHPVLACAIDDAPVGTDASAGEQWLPLASGEQCRLGPAAASGAVFLPTAVPAIIGGGWSVNAELQPGADGLDAFNGVAAWCFDGTDACPTQRLAIVVDGRIVTAPTVNVPSFESEVQIVGEFPEAEAADIASTINLSALALTLDPA